MNADGLVLSGTIRMLLFGGVSGVVMGQHSSFFGADAIAIHVREHMAN